MRASSIRIGISALVALALSLTAASTALASSDHASGGAVAAAPAPSQDHDQDQAGDDVGEDESADHGPRGRRNHPSFNDVAAVNELCNGDGDSDVPSFDIPSLDVLCSVYRRLSDRLPPQALRGQARAIAVHAGHVAPGQRDRIGGAGGGHGPIAICRRLANVNDASARAALAERCRQLLDEGVTTPAELCDRLSESGDIDEHRLLTRLCARIVGGNDDTRLRPRPASGRPGRQRPALARPQPVRSNTP